MLAPACSRPMSSVQQRDVLAAAAARRRAAMRCGEAFDDRGLADAGLAGQDRVVLAAAHQDVDDLADLLVAADDRIDLALARPLGQVDGEAASAPPACPSAPAPSRRSPRPGAASDEPSRGAERCPRASRRRSCAKSSVSVSALIVLELPRDRRAARCAATASSACRPSGGRCGRALAEHQRARRPSRARPRSRRAATDRRSRSRRAAADRARRSGPWPAATGRARSAGRCGAGRSPGVCRIWCSQCTSSTYGLPRSLQKTVAPSIAL